VSENPYAGQGSVLLDIGGDIGALVVRMPAELDGVEVEINRLDQRRHDHHHGPVADHDHHHDHADGQDHSHPAGGHRPHVAVVARPAPSGVVHSLVFPELTDGRYELYQRPAGPVELTVTVYGGQVTEVDWPASR
jgi:ABC-type Zn2+ transport system substrate-binding protein/surface adhesin